jgi:DNA invertase Pin-like site-specific DNA recombinase
MARRVSEEHGFELVVSGDERNDGVCFLDVGTGARADNRPQLQRILSDDTIDSVAFLEFDRLARGVDVQQQLLAIERAAGKKLLWIRTQDDIDLYARFMQILGDCLGLGRW